MQIFSANNLQKQVVFLDNLINQQAYSVHNNQLLACLDSQLKQSLLRYKFKLATKVRSVLNPRLAFSDLTCLALKLNQLEAFLVLRQS